MGHFFRNGGNMFFWQNKNLQKMLVKFFCRKRQSTESDEGEKIDDDEDEDFEDVQLESKNEEKLSKDLNTRYFCTQ
jgi:hypothetical protein